MVLSAIPPVYKASSRIAFERTLARYMQTNKVSNEPIIDDYDTLGQTYVISSESILLQVIRSLSLASDPDFVGGKDSEALGSRIRGLFRNAARGLGLPKEPAENQSTRSGEDRTRQRRSQFDSQSRGCAERHDDSFFVERPREGGSDR